MCRVALSGMNAVISRRGEMMLSREEHSRNRKTRTNLRIDLCDTCDQFPLDAKKLLEQRISPLRFQERTGLCSLIFDLRPSKILFHVTNVVSMRTWGISH